MSRSLLLATAFTLVFGATAAARTGEQAAQPRTLAEVRGRIDAVAQNGRHVAWIKTDASCERQLEILTLPVRRPVAIGGGTCVRERAGALPAIALSADGRVLWQTVPDVGNTMFELNLFTASLRAPNARLVSNLRIGYDDDNPDNYFSNSAGSRSLPAAGDGNAVVFYAICDSLCDRKGIYRLVGGRARRLAGATSPEGLALSGRRFAVVTNSVRCCNFKPAWSHDGTRLAWIYHGNLWTVRSNGTGDRQLANAIWPSFWTSDDVRLPSWSPDDAQIVFERTQAKEARLRSLGVYRVEASGGGLRRLATGAAPAWSPDGTRIAFVRGTGVFTIKPDGTGATRLPGPPRATVGPLSWSPDSTRIAVSRGGDIYSVRADGGGETRMTSSPRREVQPAWSPDGTRIVYVDGPTIAVINADGGSPTRLRSTPNSGDASPAWSPDSKRLAFVRGATLWITNPDGRDQRRLTSSGYLDSPQWTRDGSAIAVGDWYGEWSNYPSHPGIRLVSAANGRQRKIAPVLHSRIEIRDAVTGRSIKRFTIDGHAHAAALGPDYVALLVDHEPGVRVEVYNVNGRLRSAARVPASVHGVSAAGRAVVFATGRVIRRLDARTGAVTALATARRRPVGLTIEGRRVVWAENVRGRARIRAVTAP